MKKSLYDLQPGDAFVLYKGAAYTVSFVSKVVDGNYKVDFELLIIEGGNKIGVYDFTKGRRVYDPREWFENPGLYGKVHSTTQEEERELIEQLFTFKLKMLDVKPNV